MSKYSEVRKDTADRMRADDPADELLACRYCKAPTRRGDLSMYGARCKACFDAYCAMPMAEFNARFKRNAPQLALPRRPGRPSPQDLGRTAKPARETIAAWAAQMGIDTGDEALQADRQWRAERGVAPELPSGAMPDGRPEPPADRQHGVSDAAQDRLV